MIDISAGILVRDGRVLICRRMDGDGVAGLWEFPGGKREAGETPEACLIRECQEELGVTLDAPALLTELDWPDGARTLHFSFLTAVIAQGEPKCRVHSDIRWVAPEEFGSFTFCPADAAILGQVTAALAFTE